ncbi:hypothetical protein KMI_10g16620 [Encephalitozoon hellem]|nr:hypothetical protein KMI_10g16620 [Encephalitozoon hellem]
MVRKSLYILAAAGVGIIKATTGNGGLYIPSSVLQDLGNTSGCLMVTESGNGNFSIVPSGSPVYIEQQNGHTEVSWAPLVGGNRAVPVYAPSAQEVRESIPSASGLEIVQYTAPQQEGFVSSSTPVVAVVEEVVPVSGVAVSSTSSTPETKSTGTTTTAVGATGDKSKTTTGTTSDKSKSSSSSSSKKKKGAKSIMALGAVLTTALFSIL